MPGKKCFFPASACIFAKKQYLNLRYKFSVPVAQLDRASGYGPEGQEFESLQVRHFVAG